MWHENSFCFVDSKSITAASLGIPLLRDTDSKCIQNKPLCTICQTNMQYVCLHSVKSNWTVPIYWTVPGLQIKMFI